MYVHDAPMFRASSVEVGGFLETYWRDLSTENLGAVVHAGPLGLGPKPSPTSETRI